MLIENKYMIAFNDAFHEFYQGNQHAISLSLMLLEVSHLWDDLIDGDAVERDDIDRVFRYLIYDIPTNPVYRAIPGMPDHLLNVYLSWRDATAMESEDKPDLEKTYMLRAGIYDIFSLISYHLCGDEWSRNIGPKIRRLYGETLDSLKEEFNA